MAKALTLENALSDDRKPVKVDGESTGLLIGGKDVHIEGKSSVGGDLTVDGDLKINGNHLTFGHGEIVHNNADGSITASTPVLWIDGASAYTGDATLLIYADSGYDAKIQFWESSAIKWTVGNDADDSDKLKFDVENTAVGGATKMTLDASGNLTLVGDLAVNGDTITTDGNATFDSGGGIDLDSHSGVFKASKAGAEFSAANSAYAGMILGYTCIGLDESAATYNLTTSYAVPTDELQVSFVAPPSGKVEIEIQVGMDTGGSNVGDLYVGLSTANATSGYSALADFHESELFDGMSRGALRIIRHSWTLTGLTAGTSYQYWAGFKSSSTTGTPHLQWGGDSSGEYPDFIMKATALPNTIST